MFKRNRRHNRPPWLRDEGAIRLSQGAALANSRPQKSVVEKLIVGSVDRMLQDGRREQLNALSTGAEETEISTEEQDINLGLVISSGSALFATAGAFVYAPLALLSIPGIVLIATPFFQEAWQDWRTDRKITATTIDSILIGSLLLLQSYGTMSFCAILMLLTEKLKLRTKDHSKKGLINMLGEQPRTVWVQKGKAEIEVAFGDIQVGDILITNVGEIVPVDGIIVSGVAMIDQQILTGEAQPIEKTIGDPAFASTTVLTGRIFIEVQRAGQDTVAANIAKILNQTADLKTARQLRVETLSNKSALPVLGLSAVTLPLLGPTRAISVLFASFGYELKISGPLSLLNHLRIAVRNGILIKDGRALEALNEVDTVIFDKTGTLTLEQPHISNIYTCNGLCEDDLLTYAAAAEQRQSHPIAKAILQAARMRTLSLPTIDEAQYQIGYGIKVNLSGKFICVGSARFMAAEGVALPEGMRALQEQSNEQGCSVVFVAVDGNLGGAIELHPTIRPEAKGVLTLLRAHNLSLHLISGDHEQPTRRLAHELGIEHYVAETLPEHKAELVAQLQRQGRKVCFVGDGINDAVALKTADVSVSLQGASTIAIDTAQIILMKQDLNQLTALFETAHGLNANMQVNVLLSFASGIACLGGIYLLNYGIIQTSLLTFGISVAGIGNAMLPLVRYGQRDP